MVTNSKIQSFWCAGRNYRDHALELHNPIPTEPLIFLKSGACQQLGPQIELAPSCLEIHFELEIVLLLGSDLRPSHWTLGLDLTDRKRQTQMKSKGEPWELSKSFKGSAVLGPWQKLTGLEPINNREFSLVINGETRQIGHTRDMIFSFEELLKYLHHHFPLQPGDAVFTGTPAGVGQLKAHDRLEARSGELTVPWTVR